MSQKCCGPDEKDLITAQNDDACCSHQSEEIDSCCESKNEESYSAADISSDGNDSGGKAEYRIYGMDCPSCAVTIEKGLNRLNDVQAVKVNYNTSKLQVSGSTPLASGQIENEVQKLGFSAEPLKENSHFRTYDVAGMDCGNCAQTIEHHLKNNPSVNDVSVNFSTGKMKVAHENSVDDIVSEVSKIGYDAALHTDRETSAAHKDRKGGYGLITLSGALIALGLISALTPLPVILSTLLYAAAIVISGFKPIKSAYYAIKSRSLDMNVLMSAAAIGAALIGEWFEGAIVVWLFTLGTFLQNRSIEQTRNSIRGLMELAPSEAWVKSGGDLVKQPVEAVSLGDTIVVKPGDRIPLDGEILQGETSINQAPITGESIPVDKVAGDTVYAGTINESGALNVTVTKLVNDTTISKIIHLVEEAQEQKAPAEAFIDKFASIYTPIVFSLALAVIVLPPLFDFGSWSEWVYRGLALLVVACPCALVISTPVAIVSAIGNAAKNGILIKGGTFLEKAGNITSIAFDKTGTLTEGAPKVTEMEALTVPEHELISLAVTLEDYSTHPIAKTIVSYAKEKGIPPKHGEAFQNISGKGVQATIDGQVNYAGNLKLFKEMNIDLNDIRPKIDEMQSQGKTVVIIGTEQAVLGLISVSDTMRTSAVEALSGLKHAGVSQLAMLTGDNEGTAKMISEKTNINRYFAELMPEDKIKAIKELQHEGHNVAMVGDGINDAPALASSDLGIAMGGTGTDTAMETADIVLMADNLEKLPHTVKLSQKAMTIIKQNIWFALIVKLIALALIVPGWLTLWMAVLSDTGAALIVILNALRLLKYKEKSTSSQSADPHLSNQWKSRSV
ncbi:heavy metal translocating P-type ATPase [Salinicoccus albus]|uniref:heavy metal translocating P-type ATPase n=1 Tax=Salinicoccus albus TaxID=418756 RepID=UPI00037362A2|nr:heavy metal translocating P-type ATPase [Salinicoccus albus]